MKDKMMTLPTWLVEPVNKIDQSDDFDGRIDNLGVDRLLDLVGCLIDKVEDTQTLLNNALDRVAQSSVEIDKLRYWSHRVTNAVLDLRKQVTGDVGSGCPIDAVVILSARLRKAESEVSRLSGLLEPTNELVPVELLRAKDTEIKLIKDCLTEIQCRIVTKENELSMADAEIERLQKDRSRSENDLDRLREWVAAVEDGYDKQAAEIERLRTENKRLRADKYTVWATHPDC